VVLVPDDSEEAVIAPLSALGSGCGQLFLSDAAFYQADGFCMSPVRSCIPPWHTFPELRQLFGGTPVLLR
jgi:hypothetical protein